MARGWGAALLLLALTGMIVPHARPQIVQDRAAADELFDTLVHGIAACKTHPGADPVSRIACILEQVRHKRHMF